MTLIPSSYLSRDLYRRTWLEPDPSPRDDSPAPRDGEPPWSLVLAAFLAPPAARRAVRP